MPTLLRHYNSNSPLSARLFVSSLNKNLHPAESEVDGILAKAHSAIADGKPYTPDQPSSLEVLERFGFCNQSGSAVLAGDAELLDANAIAGYLRTESEGKLTQLQILPSVGSTNDFMQEQAKSMNIDGSVVLAEAQTAGRGRQGREWVTPFGRSIAITFGVSLDVSASSIAALSLAVGVSVADSLASLGVSGVRLKWPNDILLNGAKAGGILTELVDAARPLDSVIGIGINVGCGRFIRERVDYPIADVCDYVEGPIRNRLAAELINRILPDCRVFEREGFSAFRDRWILYDAFRGRRVVVFNPHERVEGTSLGVDSEGRLLIKGSSGTVTTVIAGEVSLRELA